MPDPISLIALGAAVGGAAGKFTEKAWDSSERWLRERFGSHRAAAQKLARENAADFVLELADRVKKLENEYQVKRQQLDDVAHHPQFSALLQRSVLNAAETSEQAKHKLLATLVANRMLSPPETTLALASHLASDAITRSTHRQLRLMALQGFIEGTRAKYPMKFSMFKVWLKQNLEPFEDFEFHEIDARHLVAIACATFDPTSQRMLGLMLAMNARQARDLRKINGILADTNVQIQWDHGLAGVELTSVGLIVGALAYDQINGRDLGPPKWD